MERTDKAAAIADIRATYETATSLVMVDYRGMTVAQVSKLRRSFAERGVRYQVLKNTLVKKALGETNVAGKLDNALRGMTGFAWSFEEPSAAARVVKEFRKENDKLVIKAGLMDGAVLSPEAVENQLAALPSKDEARSMLLATMMAPAQTFVRLINIPATSFVGVLAAKQRKMEEG